MQKINTRFGEWMLSLYQVFIFLKRFNCDTVICASKELHIFKILFKKKGFTSFDLKGSSMILKPMLQMVFERSVVT